MNEFLPSQLRHTTYILNLLEHEQHLSVLVKTQNSVNFHSKAIILFSIFLTGNWKNKCINKFRSNKSVNFAAQLQIKIKVLDVHLHAWLPLANHKPEMVFSREPNYNYQKSLRFYVIMQMVYSPNHPRAFDNTWTNQNSCYKSSLKFVASSAVSTKAIPRKSCRKIRKVWQKLKEMLKNTAL